MGSGILPSSCGREYPGLSSSKYLITPQTPAKPAGSLGLDAAGQPTRQFIKEICRVGTFTVDGRKATITADDLDRYVSAFARMKSAGCKVPVPSGHTFSADKNRGWVQDIYREGDVLVGRLELVGEDAIAMAGRNDVSVYIESDFKDGDGTAYGEAITHVALTPHPVVNKLGPFVKLAASRAGEAEREVEVLTLEKRMNWSNIAKAFGFADGELTDETAEAKLVERAGKLKPADDKAMSRDKPDPQVLSLSARVRKGEIARLKEAGKINGPTADKLAETFIGSGNVALSRDLSLTPETPDAVFDAVCDILATNKTVPLNETNTLKLSRQTPDDAPAAFDPKCMNEMLAMTGAATK